MTFPVQRESAGHYHQPGTELRTALGLEGSEPARIVLPKPLKDERVAIHDAVVIGVSPANGVEQEGAESAEEPSPAFLPPRGVR